MFESRDVISIRPIKSKLIKRGDGGKNARSRERDFSTRSIPWGAARPTFSSFN